MKQSLTAKDICTAYAEGTIRGGVAQRLAQLPRSAGAIARALGEAINQGYIETSGDRYRGWLSEAGIALLDEGGQKAYRAAVRRRGVFMGAG